MVRDKTTLQKEGHGLPSAFTKAAGGHPPATPWTPTPTSRPNKRSSH